MYANLFFSLILTVGLGTIFFSGYLFGQVSSRRKRDSLGRYSL